MKSGITNLITIFTLVAVAGFADHGYIAKMIDCPEGEEGHVVDLYWAYLTAIDHREFKEKELSIHRSLVTHNDEYILAGWTFYLTKNELTGI